MFRPDLASRDEIRRILSWAAAEGWNPGLGDAEVFHATDPQGFFVMRADETPIAAISVVNHDTDFAFLGLYLCLPEHRGRGHGMALWTHAIEHAGDRTIGLDGVFDQQENYRKSGFAAHGQTHRYRGLLGEFAAPHSCRPMNEDDRQKAIRQDRQHGGVDRQAFLTGWFADTADRQSLCHFHDGRLSGYATIRRCLEGFKIGPFSAADVTTARDLMAGLARIAGDSPVFVDVHQSRPALADLLGAAGFVSVFNTARMYRGAPPDGAAPEFAAVATLELG